MHFAKIRAGKTWLLAAGGRRLAGGCALCKPAVRYPLGQGAKPRLPAQCQSAWSGGCACICRVCRHMQASSRAAHSIVDLRTSSGVHPCVSCPQVRRNSSGALAAEGSSPGEGGRASGKRQRSRGVADSAKSKRLKQKQGEQAVRGAGETFWYWVEHCTVMPCQAEAEAEGARRTALWKVSGTGLNVVRCVAAAASAPQPIRVS